jgi:paraquat-inducible protein B
MKQAEHRKGVWIAWIWAVPIAALGIVVWLGVRSLTQGGPEVVVTFANAGGVKAGDTKVYYDKMQVGTVEDIKLHKDLKAADVTVSLDADMNGHVGPGTRFWISGQTVQLSDLSSIKSLITGPTIEMNPHDGPTQHHIRGLDQAPVLKHEPAGTQFVLHATKLGSISRGAPIYYHGLKVGEIQGFTFEPPEGFKIFAFVTAPYVDLVRVGTRFWDASAAHLSLGSGGPSFSLLSPMALIGGAVGFETPREGAGPVAQVGATFELYSSADQARYAPEPDAVSYRITLNDARAAALDDGSPVQLEGRRVGSVTRVQMRFQQGKLQSDVTVAIDPYRLQIADAPGGTGRGRMDAIMRLLVGQGLRAQLGRTTPVIGGRNIDLRFVPGAQEADLIPGSPPGIPTAPGGDIDQIVRQVSDVAGKLDALPLPAIADEVHNATKRLAQLSASPELRQTLQRLDESVTNIDDVTEQTRKQIRPLLAEVRQAAEQADKAIASAHTLVGGQGVIGPEQTSLPHALYELSEAARSLREVADLLDRQPGAVLFGKGGRP